MAEAIVQGFFEVTHVVGLEEIDEHAPCSGDARILLGGDCDRLLQPAVTIPSGLRIEVSGASAR
jgi:hypothetical protein